MKQWVKFVIIVSNMAGGVLFSGTQERFSAWADDGICDPGDPENLLTIFHGGENGKQVPDEDEIDPGALTMPSLPMRLVICKPEVSDASPEEMVILDVVAGKEKIILLDQAQENEIPPSQPFPLAELPALVWVKPTQSSEQEQDIRICAKFQKECQDFVTATALLNLEAHWPGTLDDPGEIVSEAEEDNSLNLIGSVNDDDDNDDDIIDNDREQSPSIVKEDDDVMTFLVKKLGPAQSSSDEPVFQEGTLELFAGDGLHFFTADGTEELTLPLSVDLANPSGPLADILNNDVPLLVEANIPVERTMVELIYSQNGTELARDEVHLMVVHPTVKGGFTRGSVRYSEAMRLSGKWVVLREFSHDRPISVLLPDFLGETADYRYIWYRKATEEAGEPQAWNTTDGHLIDAQYFIDLANQWNAILDWLLIPFWRYEPDDIITWLSEASGISEEVLRTGRHFATGLLEEAGRYEITLLDRDQNPATAQTVVVTVMNPGQIDGSFPLLDDRNAPYAQEDPLTEVTELDDTFFRTLGGMWLHLQAAPSDALQPYENHLVGYEWFIPHNAEYIFPPETFARLRDELREMYGVPQTIITNLQPVLEGKIFQTRDALMAAIQPVLTADGYTLTKHIIKQFKRFVDEQYFPSYFCGEDKNRKDVCVTNDGLCAVKDITYATAEELREALRTAKHPEHEQKYAVVGYRVSNQALITFFETEFAECLDQILDPQFLEQCLDSEALATYKRFRKLQRLEKDSTICAGEAEQACIRGKKGEGYSFRTMNEAGEFEQFTLALQKALGDDYTPAFEQLLKPYANHLALFREQIEQMIAAANHQNYYEDCLHAILRHGATDVGFYPNYAISAVDSAGNLVEAPRLTREDLTGRRVPGDPPLSIQDVDWQSEPRADLDDTVTLFLSMQDDDDMTRTVPITRQFKSRVLQKPVEYPEPPPKDDDVMMLQVVLRFLGWEFQKIDGDFWTETEKQVKAFKWQNRDRKKSAHDSKVTTEELKLLKVHFDDYRWALNAFDWNDGENPNGDTMTINQDYEDEERKLSFDKWVEEAATSIENLPTGIITPKPGNTDEKDFLLAAINQESKFTHWDGWKVTFSENVGALGFLQIMSFNSSRYNDTGNTTIIDEEQNVYKPDENLQAAAQLFDEYLERAFSGNWTQSGDDDDDLLAKALARYNSGGETTLQQNSWEKICRKQIAFPNQGLYYAVGIKKCLNLTIEDFEKPYEPEEAKCQQLNN